MPVNGNVFYDPALTNLVALIRHVDTTALIFTILHTMARGLWFGVPVAAFFTMHPVHATGKPLTPLNPIL